ncbi:MAG TPA: phage holin family protein [Burkholderiales bacterium]|nr:phage holin family protein [Burkholderiales bacterium]
MTEEAGHPEGLLESLRDLAATFVALVQTRIEIFASEVDEERTRLARIAVLALTALFCLGLAVVLLVLLVAVIFWDEHRLLAVGLLAALFALCGLASLLALRSAVRKRPKFLSATLAELRKDEQELGRR